MSQFLHDSQLLLVAILNDLLESELLDLTEMFICLIHYSSVCLSMYPSVSDSFITNRKWNTSRLLVHLSRWLVCLCIKKGQCTLFDMKSPRCKCGRFSQAGLFFICSLLHWLESVSPSCIAESLLYADSTWQGAPGDSGHKWKYSRNSQPTQCLAQYVQVKLRLHSLQS